MKITNSYDLTGKVIIVTGGAGLLGREYTLSLIDEGAKVVVADIDDQATDQFMQTLNTKAKKQVLAIKTNVSEKTSVENMVMQTLITFGQIDGLVNNAALDPKFDGSESQNDLTFENYPLELWNKSLEVDITGMFLCTQAVAPTMLKQGGGVIVNMSSIYGMVGPDQRLYEHDDPDAIKTFKPVTYSVTKSAVYGLTKYLASYWAGKDIRVNTLTLGGVFNNHDIGFTSRYAMRTPLGRMADRSEVSGALLFLLSKASSYMTGSNLVVDGGWTVW